MKRRKKKIKFEYALHQTKIKRSAPKIRQRCVARERSGDGTRTFIIDDHAFASEAVGEGEKNGKEGEDKPCEQNTSTHVTVLWLCDRTHFRRALQVPSRIDWTLRCTYSESGMVRGGGDVGPEKNERENDWRENRENERRQR
jgi:hypothetical protein